AQSFYTKGDTLPLSIAEDPHWMIANLTGIPEAHLVSFDASKFDGSPDHLHFQSTTSHDWSNQSLDAFSSLQQDLRYGLLPLRPTLTDPSIPLWSVNTKDSTQQTPTNFTHLTGDPITQEISLPLADTSRPSAFQCKVHGCKFSKTYRTETEFKRHMNKHTRPFRCMVHNCHVRPFSDRAGLLRHTREVHKLDKQGEITSKYTCPESGCKRHKRGFARQWNMVQHFRRAHTDGNECPGRRVRSSSPEASEDMDIDSAGVEISATDTPQQSTEVCDGLRSKLARLRQEKSRVEMEIVAVQKVIEVFERPEL
ncbi:hypothetical protein MMC11_007240, partial [Xylographa trunciseda]|nr:hypothetical protein [Xylographa trunciseda]